MIETRIAITLLAIAVLIEGWFILRLMRDLVKLEAARAQDLAKVAEIAAGADKARKLGQAAQRAVGRLKQSLQGDQK